MGEWTLRRTQLAGRLKPRSEWLSVAKNAETVFAVRPAQRLELRSGSGVSGRQGWGKRAEFGQTNAG